MSALLQSTPIRPMPATLKPTATDHSNRRMLCLVIGQEPWEDILRSLPDSFFDMDEAGQEAIWGRMVHAAVRGQTDHDELLAIAYPASGKSGLEIPRA